MVLWVIKCTACFVFALGGCLYIQVVCLFPELYEVDEMMGLESAPWRIPSAKPGRIEILHICILSVCVGLASWKCSGLSVPRSINDQSRP